MEPNLLKLLLFHLLCLGFPLSLHAQSIIILDYDSGEVVKDAEIKVYNLIGVEVLKTKTDNSGKFYITVNEKGTYLIHVSKQGYVSGTTQCRLDNAIILLENRIIMKIRAEKKPDSAISANIRGLTRDLPENWASPSCEDKISLLDLTLRNLPSSPENAAMFQKYGKLVASYNSFFLNSLKEMPLEFPRGFSPCEIDSDSLFPKLFRRKAIVTCKDIVKTLEQSLDSTHLPSPPRYYRCPGGFFAVIKPHPIYPDGGLLPEEQYVMVREIPKRKDPTIREWWDDVWSLDKGYYRFIILIFTNQRIMPQNKDADLQYFSNFFASASLKPYDSEASPFQKSSCTVLTYTLSVEELNHSIQMLDPPTARRHLDKTDLWNHLTKYH